MNISCRKAFSEQLLELGRNNPDIYAVTSDARGSVTLNDFSRELPEQFVETGIAEQNSVGVGGGLAACGKIPFVCAPSPFLSGRSYEQIKIDAVYNNRNVKLVGVSGGISYGTLGYSHHSPQDIAVLRTLPGLTVLVPSDGVQTKALTRYMAQNEGPMYLRTGRNSVPQVYAGTEQFEIGKAKQLRSGNDAAILAVGEMVSICANAAEILSRRGLQVRVLDMFSIKPLDTEAVKKAALETGHIITAEEHSVLGGLGGAVCEIVSQYCPVPVKIIGLPDGHIAAGESPQVYSYYGWTPEGIADSIMQWIRQYV